MQGYEVTLYEGASGDRETEWAVTADRMRVWWRARRESAEALADQLRENYGDPVTIRG